MGIYFCIKIIPWRSEVMNKNVVGL